MKLFPFLLAVTILIGTPGLPEATGCALCSCAPKMAPRMARDSSYAVFSGRVIALLDRPVPPPDTSVGGSARRDADMGYIRRAGDRLRVTIEVQAVWKGNIGSRVEVFTANECCICGFPFQLGKEYLVYAYRGSAGQLRASLCSRTRSLSDATEDFTALGSGAAPAHAGDDSPLPPHN